MSNGTQNKICPLCGEVYEQTISNTRSGTIIYQHAHKSDCGQTIDSETIVAFQPAPDQKKRTNNNGHN